MNQWIAGQRSRSGVGKQLQHAERRTRFTSWISRHRNQAGQRHQPGALHDCRCAGTVARPRAESLREVSGGLSNHSKVVGVGIQRHGGKIPNAC